MGNRAVITTNINKPDSQKIGIYLHWNGGRDSVEAFLTYCKIAGYRGPVNDSYGMARLIQVISNFFGGGLSIGVDTVKCLNNGEYCDNGMYIIDENWDIVGRENFDGLEQRYYNLSLMLAALDDHMPEGNKVGYEAINKWLTENGHMTIEEAEAKENKDKENANE